MANHRKYFKYGISQLEDLFGESQDNIGVLEEIEEELEHRKTNRAKKLLTQIQSRLNTRGNENLTENEPQKVVVLPSPTHETEDTPPQHPIDNEIDWGSVVKKAKTLTTFPDPIQKSPQVITNEPIDILESWIAVEAFSPQTYRRPHDLQGNGSVAYLKDGEPWFRGEKSRPNCNLYYVIYLGAVELERATEKLMSVYQDKRVERPDVKGKTALGAILVNKLGVPVPETGVAVSSFGWAYGQALDGHLNRIKHWEEAEKVLLEELDKLVYHQDENGQDAPLTLSQIQHIYKWLIHVCRIPEDDTVEPSFSIRLFQTFSRGEPEIPLLNSFYLSDLQWASSTIHSGSSNQSVSQYLSITKPAEKADVLQDKSYLEDALQPKYTPLGRWPSQGRFPLVLLQQAAVNLSKRELKTEGIFSVNGPPGTGKTTLLRDIVAHNIVERAIALSNFDEVDKAFTHAGKMKVGKGFAHIYQLSDSIRGFEMLVASSNNKAIENISKELPLASQVSGDLVDFSYFKTISDSLCDDNESSWGMIAAVLGNTKNRSNFTNKVWWDDQTGLKTYFQAITGQISRNPNDHEEGIVPPVIEGCDAPIDIADAKRRWKIALSNFKNSLSKAQKNNDLAQKSYESTISIKDIEGKIVNIKSYIVQQNEIVGKIKEQLQQAKHDSSNAEIELNKASADLREFSFSRPGFLSRLFFRAKWHIWHQQNQRLTELRNSTKHFANDTKAQYLQVDSTYKDSVSELDRLNSELTELENHYQQALRNVQAATHICGNQLVTPELWDYSHETQQKHTPTFVKEAHYIRDELFVAAMQLHKAFIDAASKQIRQNLSLFFFMLSNGKIPEDKQTLIPHLWATAFLFTPVISTTFASVGRMLKKLPSNSIGWLLTDEAGQAIPQAAIGSIIRAKRVLVVGDPLQIEPIVTLPLPLLESIFKHHKVDPYLWGAPYSSVQTLADESSPYGTSISRDLEEIRIGTPLLVHRRCENPMFKISNLLAYNGQMVPATPKKESALTSILGESQWFDVKGSAQEKWCPEEGELVAQMILKAASALNSNLNIFVITPFKIVEQSMRNRMMKEVEPLKQYGIDPTTWIRENIGTVHTFQGKEAHGVILLLGATSPTQNGARNWATMNVNLLNVAVSRAKQNFYVVGNQQLWGEMGNMKIVSRYLKRSFV